MTEIYPVAQGIIEEQVASECEVCKFLGFSRSPFHRWKQFELSPLEEEDKRLLLLIARSFHTHRRRYGTRRIRDDLRHQGYALGRRRVVKLMKIEGVSAIQPKIMQTKNDRKQTYFGIHDNLIMDLKELKQSNRLWVGDITCIPIQAIQFGYLAVLMDRFSRSIIGWKLGTDMTEQIVIKALRMAIRNRKPAKGLIHHSDRGGQ